MALDAVGALARDAIGALARDAIGALARDAIGALARDAIGALARDAIGVLALDAIGIRDVRQGADSSTGCGEAASEGWVCAAGGSRRILLGPRRFLPGRASVGLGHDGLGCDISRVCASPGLAGTPSRSHTLCVKRSFLLALALMSCGLASADVVHLRHGGLIQGEIVEETSTKVVVKTRNGSITIPRRKVAKVTREARGVLLLGQGRQALLEGDVPAARRLFEKARKVGDKRIAKRAAEELEALAARGESEPDQALTATKLRWGGQGDPFTEVEKEALFRELEVEAQKGVAQARARLQQELFQRGERRHAVGEHRLAASDFRRGQSVASDANRLPLRLREQRCRLEVATQALREQASGLALAAAGPVAEDPCRRQEEVRAQYLVGRAHELSRNRTKARESYQRALPVKLSNASDLATFRELARLASVGLKVNGSSPGVGEGWRAMETRHFAIVHQGNLDEKAVGARFEAYRAEVIERLELRGKLDERGRVAVFIFASREAYAQHDGARTWSAGHASRMRAQGELIRAIYLHFEEDLERVAVHEIAHILVGDALNDALIPAWTNEGAAMFAEPARHRLGRRRFVQELYKRSLLRPSRDALGQMLPPLTNEQATVQVFYAQASLNFDLLARRLGIRRTFSCAKRINTEGPQRALSSVGLGLHSFEQLVEKALQEEAR